MCVKNIRLPCKCLRCKENKISQAEIPNSNLKTFYTYSFTICSGLRNYSWQWYDKYISSYLEREKELPKKCTVILQFTISLSVYRGARFSRAHRSRRDSCTFRHELLAFFSEKQLIAQARIRQTLLQRMRATIEVVLRQVHHVNHDIVVKQDAIIYHFWNNYQRVSNAVN